MDPPSVAVDDEIPQTWDPQRPHIWLHASQHQWPRGLVHVQRHELNSGIKESMHNQVIKVFKKTRNDDTIPVRHLG